MASAANQRRATYDKNNTVMITLKLNRKTDSDVIRKLESVNNRNQFLKNLIRRTM